MTYTRTTWVDNTTLVDAAKMNNIETELALLDPLLAKSPPLSTTIPASPVDGQEVILVNSLTAPDWYWHMRYVAGSSYAQKWIFLGGQSLALWYPTSQSMPGNWAAYLPTTTVPFAGLYTLSAQGWFVPAAAGMVGMSAWIGAEDSDYKVFGMSSGAGNVTLKTDGIGKTFTAGALVSLAGYTNVGCTLQNVRTAITPVRLA